MPGDATHPGKVGLFILLLTVLMLGGCWEKESDHFKSEDLGAHMVVEAGGNGSAEVRVQLFAREFLTVRDIELADEDTLFAAVNGRVERLRKVILDIEDGEEIFDYEALFHNVDPGAQFVISLDRTGENGHWEAPNSFVTLPGPGDLFSPSDGQAIIGGGPLLLAWRAYNAADRLKVTLAATCGDANFITNVTKIDLRIIDSGSVEIDLQPLQSAIPSSVESGEICKLNIELEGKQQGTLDTAFGEGGDIVVISRRDVDAYLIVDR